MTTQEIHDLLDRISTLAMREHYLSGPEWHTCPKTREGSEHEKCFCGADARNAHIAASIRKLRTEIARYRHDDTPAD